jgi:hypothetical protein
VSHDEARHRCVKTAPKPLWPGIVIAGGEVALLVALLAVALSGAFVLVAGAFAVLTLLGVARLGVSPEEVGSLVEASDRGLVAEG